MIPYIGEYKRYHELLTGTLEQLSEPEFFTVLSPASNSVAVIMKHLSGNLASRFTDFLTTDGEKEWRNREAEFDVTGLSRTDVMTLWDDAWTVLKQNVWTLEPDDMLKPITVRGVTLSVEEALTRSVSHFAYHVGEIVFIARHFRGSEWRYLSIAPGESATYNKNPNREKIQ